MSHFVSFLARANRGEEEEEGEGEEGEEFQVCFWYEFEGFPWRLVPPFLGFS